MLIVDDGSQDSSARIAERAAVADERIKVVRLEHEGLVSALNVGLAESRAPLVARMDADDISYPRRLELQAKYLRAHPEISVVSCLVETFPPDRVGEGMILYEKWLNSLVDEKDIVRDIFVESPFAHPSVMFRKDRTISAGGYRNMGWPEDYELWLRLYAGGAKFGKVAGTLLRWRDTPGRLSRCHSMYSDAAFRMTKLHYLLQTHLSERRRVTLWGAGRTGRWWCRELHIAGVDVARFIDVDAHKIGRAVGDIPIVSPFNIYRGMEDDFILGCVGSRGARDRIRAFLIDAGYVELQDFIMIA